MCGCELGASDKQIHCRSHLGHLLHTGDTVWGWGGGCVCLRVVDCMRVGTSRYCPVAVVDGVGTKDTSVFT